MNRILLKIAILTISIYFIGCNSNDDKVLLVGWGDSMLKGAGGDISVIESMSDELELDYINFSVGGLKSESVAALQGGIPLKLVLENNQINKKGSTKITNYNVEPFNYRTKPYRYGNLNGIEGKIVRIFNEANKRKTLGFKFNPKNIKENILVEDSVVFEFDDAAIHRESITVIWAGRNDNKDSISALKTVSNISAMVENLNESSKDKYLVLSLCNGISSKEGYGTRAQDQILALNDLLCTSFNNNYVDIRSYLMHQAIYEMGDEPTAQEKYDIEQGCIPRRFFSDHVHFNTLAYQRIGKYLAEIVKERKWN